MECWFVTSCQVATSILGTLFRERSGGLQAWEPLGPMSSLRQGWVSEPPCTVAAREKLPLWAGPTGASETVSCAPREAAGLGQSGLGLPALFLGDATLIPVLK